MEKFIKHRARVAALDRANVDTDQIIPKQFLKLIKRTGFGPALFFDWRYTPDGKDNPEFELNAAHLKDASILVTRNNFGCGSSREHAVWAIAQYGFKAVIAPWRQLGDVRIPAFADIFRNNAVNNGLLTIELAEAEVEEIFRAARKHQAVALTIDLPEQKVILHTPGGEKVFTFQMDAGVKKRFIEGLDAIGLTLEHEADITAFEKRHDVQLARSA